jgi:hypothetical protein
MREETTSRVMAADRPYGEFYDFSASVRNILDKPSYFPDRKEDWEDGYVARKRHERFNKTKFGKPQVKQLRISYFTGLAHLGKNY